MNAIFVYEMKEDAEKDKGKDNNRIWGAILFGLIGATVTTFAVIALSSICFTQSILGFVREDFSYGFFYFI